MACSVSGAAFRSAPDESMGTKAKLGCLKAIAFSRLGESVRPSVPSTVGRVIHSEFSRKERVFADVQQHGTVRFAFHPCACAYAYPFSRLFLTYLI